MRKEATINAGGVDDCSLVFHSRYFRSTWEIGSRKTDQGVRDCNALLLGRRGRNRTIIPLKAFLFIYFYSNTRHFWGEGIAGIHF